MGQLLRPPFRSNVAPKHMETRGIGPHGETIRARSATPCGRGDAWTHEGRRICGNTTHVPMSVAAKKSAAKRTSTSQAGVARASEFVVEG